MQTHRRGLTLLELVICTVIIAILLSLGLLAIGATRENSRNTACQHRLKQQWTAIAAYYNDPHRHKLPAASEWRIDILPGLEERSLYDEIRQARARDSGDLEKFKARNIEVYICPSVVGREDPGARDYAATKSIRDKVRKLTLDGVWLRGVLDTGRTRFLVVEQAGLPNPQGEISREVRPENLASQANWFEEDTSIFLPSINRENYNGIYSFHRNSANILYTDGSVKAVSDTMDRQLILQSF
jgi:prepilin-type N-terminal cleavage/methylation domain-containing protein/prepilin-type processing-associated H-X9-DG protein